MKICPECGRDYDNTMSFCLDDGAELLYGPGLADEPATAILHETDSQGEPATRAQIHTTGQTAILPTDSGAPNAFDKRLLLAPVVLALIVLAGFGVYRYLSPSPGQINSIAVLPFANTSGDKETDFLSDGIAETLINNFTRIPELKVTARSTAFRFRGREGEPKEIGRELGVGSILTGTVQRRDTSVAIQVDLINTSDGTQIWGSKYDGRASDVVSIQQRIANDISSHLKLTLAQAQKAGRVYTENSEAYQHYLRGRYYLARRTSEQLGLAIGEFEQAASKDPNYALAYVGLADAYVLQDEYAGLPNSETLPKAKAFVDRALALDSELAEAYASLGHVHGQLWQWSESEAAFRRAIQLNPNYPTTYHWYTITLRYQNRLEEALATIKKGTELDPLSLIIKSNYSMMLRMRGEFDAALRECQVLQSLDPNFIYTHECFASVYLELGRFDEALSEYEKYVAVRNDRSALSNYGSALAIAGRRDEAYRQAARLEQMFSQRKAEAIHVAGVYSALAERDKAFEWIERSLERRESSLAGVGSEYVFRSIKSDPRLKSVLTRLNLPTDK